MKFEVCGLLTEFWFCLPLLFELMTLYYLHFAGSFLAYSEGFYYGGFESFSW